MAVELATAYVSIVPSFKGGVNALQGEAGKLGKSASDAIGGEISKASGRGGSIFKAFAGIAAAGGAIFGGAKLLGGFLAEATEAQKVGNQTAAVLKSTGSAAGVSAKQIGDLATALSNKAGVDDEVIQSGENVLLTFTKVANQAGKGNDIFNQATGVALDMSKALGTDLQGSVIQVGKALNDPIKGITALQRVGVSFTEQQKDQIKALVESGDTLGAQKLILKELNTEFGGAAEAQATAGDKLKVVWGNVQEQLGGYLLPIFGKVADWLSGALPKAVDFGAKAVHGIADAFAFFRDGFTGMGTNEGSGIFLFLNQFGMRLGDVWATVQDVLPKVRDVIVTALGAVVTWIQDHWTNIKAVFAGVFDAFAKGAQFIIDHKPIMIGILTAIGGAFAIQAAAATAAAIASAAAWIAAMAVPIAIGAAFAALVAGVIYAYQKVDWFHTTVDAIWQGIVAGVQWLEANWRDIWNAIYADISGVVDTISTIIQINVTFWRTIISAELQVIQFIWQHFGDAIISIVQTAWNFVSSIIQAALTTIRGIIQVVTSLIRGDWGGVWDGIQKIVDGVWQNIRAIVQLALDNLHNAIKVGVDLIKVAWMPIDALFSWFNDHVVVPIENAVDDLTGRVVSAFQKAVSAVGAVWRTLESVVKAPINIVIGFYNDGIRWVWNNIISKIPGVGDLAAVSYLNTGGKVPGSGNRDTVPAMLTPGEFVINKKSAQLLGPKALEALNSGGSIDPAILGYAAGGAVRSAEEVQAFARQQAGKPYVFPLVGPSAFDCSGLASAIVNFALGLFPWARRFSSGSVGSDHALQRGDGDPTHGLLIGAKPPFMTNRSGDLVGHVATTIAGLNAEATPPAVRVGGAARAWNNSLFSEHYFLPNFGGLTDDEKSTVGWMRMLRGLTAPAFGGPPIGDLLTKMFHDFPHMIFDFFMQKLPQIIKDAVIDVGVQVGVPANPIGQAVGLFKSIFGDGGEIRHNGPVIVGDRGVPEILWNSKGQYVESLSGGGRGGALIHVEGNIIGDSAFRQTVRDELGKADFMRRASPRLARA